MRYDIMVAVKTFCYTGLGLILHLTTPLTLLDWPFWAIILLASIIDVMSGWIEIDKIINALPEELHNVATHSSQKDS